MQPSVAAAPFGSGTGAPVGEPIPGLTADYLGANLQALGMGCIDLGGDDPQEVFVACEAYDDPQTLWWQAYIYGSEPDTVHTVQAIVSWTGAGDGDSNFDDFLGFVATVEYEGASPEDARAWVTEHSSGTMTFGNATYTLESAANGQTRTLTITGR